MQEPSRNSFDDAMMALRKSANPAAQDFARSVSRTEPGGRVALKAAAENPGVVAVGGAKIGGLWT